MIVRRLEDILETDRHIKAETWTSRRLLLKDEGMGFSLHDTILYAGTETRMHYKHHLEAVYVIEGKGQLINLETDEVHELTPFTMYALDKHDLHILRAIEDVRCVCAFNPPVSGNETHGPDGAYPPSTD